MPNHDFFFFPRRVRKIVLYSDFIYTLIRLEISHRTKWWYLKCMLVYLARDIPAFVMYCVYGASPSSLLIESNDSMICTSNRFTVLKHVYFRGKVNRRMDKCLCKR